MDGGAIAGFATIGVLVVGNAVYVAYSFGKVKQKVDDLCGRITRLEESQNCEGKKK